jgi:hypothetical protein
MPLQANNVLAIVVVVGIGQSATISTDNEHNKRRAVHAANIVAHWYNHVCTTTTTRLEHAGIVTHELLVEC